MPNAAATQTSTTMNLGQQIGENCKLSVINTSTDLGFSVGDVVTEIMTQTSGVFYTMNLRITGYGSGVLFTTGVTTGGFDALNTGTGAITGMTNTKWHYKLDCYRAW